MCNAPCSHATAARPCTAGRRRFLGVASGCLLSTVAAARAADGGKPIDVGTFTDYPADIISEQFARHDFFVIRHAGRLFATVAICPHKGNYLVRDATNPQRILCTGHDSIFDPNGMPVAGRVRRGLERLAIRLDPAGRILVDPNRRFSQPQWKHPESFLALPARPPAPTKIGAQETPQPGLTPD